ncbi:Hypothetical predicted protein [Podarcis lilfordi]|uniref:Uncharacterized protein n=1 Tax=Podarcis lilfordi TaxID=74358 RepID=A0AA35PVD6_9SAUR|nr:Hypothetical predicted protein [Podarcis lilfordi]
MEKELLELKKRNVALEQRSQDLQSRLEEAWTAQRGTQGGLSADGGSAGTLLIRLPLLAASPFGCIDTLRDGKKRMTTTDLVPHPCAGRPAVVTSSVHLLGPRSRIPVVSCLSAHKSF